MSRALKVGVTGGIAGGKSTVAGWLRDAGFTVVDADHLVVDLYQPGGEGTAVVRQLLGADMLAADGSVDRAKVAARVFSDADARKALEKAIHPLVRKRFEEISAAAQDQGVVVLEATLLVEAGYAPMFDLIVTVEADGETRLRRAINRGMDEASARARLVAQGDGGLRKEAAHRVIDNCGALPHLRRQVDELIEELERMAKAPREG